MINLATGEPKRNMNAALLAKVTTWESHRCGERETNIYAIRYNGVLASAEVRSDNKQSVR